MTTESPAPAMFIDDLHQEIADAPLPDEIHAAQATAAATDPVDQPESDTETPGTSEESGEQPKPEDEGAKTDADTKSDEPGTEGDEDEDAGEDGKAPKKSGIQKRLDRQERKLRAEFEDRAKALQEEIERLKQPTELPKAEDDPEPQEDAYPDYETFMRAKHKWMDREEGRADQAKQTEASQSAAAAPKPDAATEAEKARQADLREQFAERSLDFSAKTPDFKEVAHNPDLKITAAMAEVIMESEVGPELAYHLGQNPDKAALIAGLSPLKAAAEIGRIEASIKGAKTAPKPVPKNPAQPTPKVAGSDAPGRALGSMSYADFKKARMGSGK